MAASTYPKGVVAASARRRRGRDRPNRVAHRKPLQNPRDYGTNLL